MAGAVQAELVPSTPSSFVSHHLSSVSDWLAPLTASASGTNADFSAQDAGQDRTGLDPRSPLFRKLLAGIIYSRWLALTYYVVLAGILVVFIAANWAPRVKWWFKRRAQAKAKKSHSIAPRGGRKAKKNDALLNRHSDSESSSSSPPPRRICNYYAHEQTPLLDSITGPSKAGSSISNVKNRISSWLMYQPASLPGFRNRVMPSNGTTLLILAYLAVNVFYLLWNIEFTVPMLFILSDRAAVLFITNLPVLYILSAKNQPLQPFTGYSYASLNIVHRRLGEWMCLLAAVHGISMVVVWATLLRPGGYEFVRFITDRVVILGLCALFCYETIQFSSIATVRQMAYEVFLAVHVFLQVAALVLLYFHHPKSRPYVLISLGVWAVDRFVYRMIAKTNTYKGKVKRLPDRETCRITVDVPFKKANWVQKALGLQTVRQGWKVLDHVFISVPALGYKHILQTHPFSVASQTPLPHYKTGDLQIIIRGRNGFSKDLLEYSCNHEKVSVRIDGPYGSRSAARLLDNSDARIIITGGSGIAVTYPLLSRLLEWEYTQYDDMEDAVITQPVRPLLFVWIVHNGDQRAWCDLPRLKWLGQRPGVEIVSPDPTDEMGRPDLSSIMRQWLVKQHLDEDSVGVVVSGPDAMSRTVRNECAALKRDGLDVTFEAEKYGW